MSIEKILTAIVNFFAGLVARATREQQMTIARCLGYFWFYALPIRRQVGLENLRICFPDYTEAKRRHILRESFVHNCLSLIEILRMATWDPDRDGENFVIENRQCIDQYADKKQGYFILSLHTANGYWAGAGLNLNGFKMQMVVKDINVRALNNFLNQTRERVGNKVIPPRNSASLILRALKAGEGVAFMLDQFMGPPYGLKTTFFGKETGTAFGLALLAERANAPVILGYPVRLEDGKTHIKFGPEIEFVKSPNPENTIRDMTQKYNDALEAVVRNYPEQWLWVHRRFKQFRE